MPGKILPPPSWGRWGKGPSSQAVEIFAGRTRRAAGPLQGTGWELSLRPFLVFLSDLVWFFPAVSERSSVQLPNMLLNINDSELIAYKNRHHMTAL